MWDWLRAHKVPFYDMFWQIQGMMEYEKIYGVSVRKELAERNMGGRC